MTHGGGELRRAACPEPEADHMPDAWVTDTAQRKRCSTIVRNRHEPTCYVCGEPIDYTLRYPNPLAFSVEHVIPRAARPDLTFDTANMRASHHMCNLHRGKTTLTITERATSRRW